jgi:hypothetical protein
VGDTVGVIDITLVVGLMVRIVDISGDIGIGIGQQRMERQIGAIEMLKMVMEKEEANAVVQYHAMFYRHRAPRTYCIMRYMLLSIFLVRTVHRSVPCRHERKGWGS